LAGRFFICKHYPVISLAKAQSSQRDLNVRHHKVTLALLASLREFRRDARVTSGVLPYTHRAGFSCSKSFLTILSRA
jgi:hypothetical protein